MRLIWKQTFPGKTNDFSGRDPDNPPAYCRVYLSQIQNKPWFWVASREGGQIGSGYELTAEEAAEQAEAAYFWRPVGDGRY